MEKREVIAKLDKVEERLLKVEEDVITCMCLDLKRDERFSSTEFGKILSGIVKNYDLDEIGHTCNAQEAGIFSSYHSFLNLINLLYTYICCGRFVYCRSL